MKDSSPSPSRRCFLKTAGAAGLGAIVAPLTAGASSPGALQSKAEPDEKVAMRPFGRTGQQVSILSLGGMFDVPNNQLLLKQAIKWGVTYWDTAHSYGGGRSENGIGKYFSRYPQDRSDIFLVTKSGAWSINGMSREEQRVIALDELKARNGKSSELDLRSALELVQEYEAQGWEMIDVQRDSPGSSSVMEKWTWLMRKPKQ